MVNEETIAVFLTENQAQMFVEFQKLGKNFDILVKSGFFDTRNGQNIVHFDHDGNIGRIERHSDLYCRGQVC